MGTVRDKTGMRFGRRTVLNFVCVRKKKSVWLTRCDCGTVAEVSAPNLLFSESCGCMQSEAASRAKTVHGGASRKCGETRTYRIWKSMKSRCLCKGASAFYKYGGRGISICPEWADSYERFLADMGECPSDKHSIERNNVNGDYEPLNCRWATAIEQANNTRRTRFIEVDGEKVPLSQLARTLGVPPTRLMRQIASGWTPTLKSA